MKFVRSRNLSGKNGVLETCITRESDLVTERLQKSRKVESRLYDEESLRNGLNSFHLGEIKRR